MTTQIDQNNIQPATLAALQPVTITSIQVTDSSWTPIDDSAVSTSGGYIVITGANFVSGCNIIISSTNATSVAFVNSTTLRVQVPALSAGTYVVYVVNPNGATAIIVNGLTYSGTPTWVTVSPLAGVVSVPISIQLSATGDAPLTYTVQAGSTLPAGLTLTSGGLLSGTITGVTSETTYNFTVVAIDAQSQDSPKAFSIIITVGDQYWNYVTTLLPGTISPSIFNDDASTNNFPVSVFGDTRPNNFGPYTPGYYSNFFDGNGDYLQIANDASNQMGSGDWTAEAWIYITSYSSLNPIIAKGGSTTDWFLGTVVTSGRLYFGIGANDYFTTTGPVVPINTWSHVALVRSGTTLSTYLNGVLGSTLTGITQNFASTGALNIGRGRDTSTNYFSGYISNARLVKGTAVYTANFTPPTAPLTAIAGTSLLTCQSNRFIDNSTNNFTITVFGNTSITGFDSFVPATEFAGNGSTYFDGTGDRLTVASNAAFQLGTGNYTFETWIYPTALGVSNTNNIINIGDYTNGLLLRVNDTTTGINVYTNNVNRLATTTGLTANAWQHIALVRNGSACTVYINGVVNGTFTDSSSISPATATVTIGMAAHNSSEFFTGYMSNYRLIKGQALYTSSFVPPTAPLTAVTGTSLLTCQTNQPNNNNMFLDSSSNNFLITRFGNTTQGTVSPYGSNWSNYFDGTGDYLTLPATSGIFNFGTGDFTVEAWIYPTALLGFQQIAGSSYSTVGGALYLNGTSAAFYTNASNALTPAGSIVAYTWQHVAAVRASGILKMYINGVEQSSQALTQNLTSATAAIGSRTASPTTELYFGYISNLRAVKNAVYTTNFTPSTTPLQPILGTSLLTCADNSFVDKSANQFAITRNGDVRPQKFGPFAGTTLPTPYFSGYFDGNNDYITPAANAAFTMGTGDFTYECWVNRQGVNPVSAANALTVFDTRTAEPSIAPCLFWENDAMKYFVNGASRIVSTSTFPIGTWAHIAIVRNSGTTKMYVNGVQEGGNYTDANTYVGTTTIIGGRFAAVSGDFRSWFGYISNARIVKGTAVYTANFTPSTVPLTTTSQDVTSSNVSLLTCQSSTFIDNSINNFAITVVGNTRPTMYAPFSVVYSSLQPYTPAAFGGSMYFDGTGDYLSIADNAAFDFTGDFTMEAWVYPTVIGANNAIVAQWVTGGLAFIYKVVTNGRLQFVANTGASVTTTATTTTVQLNQWNHVAVTRSGTTVRLFVNGVLDATTGTVSGTLASTTPLTIGTVGAETTQYWNGYLSSLRIVKGTALYTSNFAAPATPLTPVTNTILLLDGTGAAVYDASALNNFETVGDTKLSTVQSNWAGSTSMFFDGIGDYLIAPNSPTTMFGIGDFTVEFWTNRSSGSNSRFIEFSTGLLYVDGNGKLVYYSTNDRIVSTNVFPSNQWVYVALARASGQSKLYINGVQTGSTFTDAINYTSGVLIIGTDNGSKSQFLTGYMQDIRITTGVARYTANFTPPTTPFITN
jgi:hypothetical protein